MSFESNAILDASFYRGMRNTLTARKLDLNIELAKKIKKPSVFGVFDNESDYLETLELFLESTLETRHRGIFFLRKVLPQLIHKNTLLDIGPGNGQLIKWVGNSFQEVTALDINRRALKLLNSQKKILRKHIKLTKINASLLDVELLPNKYDLVLLSHILYYLSRIHWMEAVKKAYNSVRSGGILAIVLNGDNLDKLHLTKYFNGELISIEDLVHCCRETFSNSKVEVFESVEFIKTLDLETMLKVAGFFLYDVNALVTEEELTRYINVFLKKTDGNYKINFAQKFILIYKS